MFANATDVLTDVVADPYISGGFFVLCSVMLGALIWVIKNLMGIIRNDLAHVKKKLNDLPCQKGGCEEGK